MSQGTATTRTSTTTAILCLLAWSTFGCEAHKPINAQVLADLPAANTAPSQPAPPPTDAAIDWKKEIGDVIAPPSGFQAELNAKDQVYAITIPRADLNVNIEGMSVPTAAGIASRFYFYKCSCGKMSVLGEFILADYEANDVIDALRLGAIIRITAVSPFAISERPRLLSVRFHGEGEATPLAKLIREALRWTGEERMKPAK